MLIFSFIALPVWLILFSVLQNSILCLYILIEDLIWVDNTLVLMIYFISGVGNKDAFISILQFCDITYSVFGFNSKTFQIEETTVIPMTETNSMYFHTSVYNDGYSSKKDMK